MTRTLVAFCLLTATTLACDREASATGPVTPAPAAVAPAGLADALAHYETIRKALLADDDAGAVAAAGTLASAAASDPEIAAAARALGTAPNLAARRARFGDLSRVLVLRVGQVEGLKLFVYHCPMVYDGYGYWLQPERGIGNPYMGTSMPRCGGESSLKAALKAAAR